MFVIGRRTASPEFVILRPSRTKEGRVSELQDQIEYHAARAIEELECSECARIDAERGAHMELSRLHLNQAGRLRMTEPTGASPDMPPSFVLDMGEASREQGFRGHGCR